MDTEPKHQPTVCADTDYAELYTIGAVAAVLLVAIIAVLVVAFLNWPFASGTNTTEEIFDLVQRSFPGGLTALDIGVSLGNLLAILLYLALYQAHTQTNPSVTLIALAFGLVAAAALIAARPVVEIFVLAEFCGEYPLGEIAEPHRYVELGHTQGNVVVNV